MEESKKRKNNYIRRIKKIKSDKRHLIDPISLDILCKKASHVIETLATNNKKEVIRDIIDKIIIKKDNKVEVCGRISLKRPQEGLKSCHASRHLNGVIPTIEFEFYCLVPKPRTRRIIVERDKLSRIVQANSPSLTLASDPNTVTNKRLST
jgi:hypothetical protein